MIWADSSRRDAGGRRGVLLLICVSMLTLFMMLGTAYLVVATRARESARALARRTLTADEARVDHAAMLDNVLLTVVRGPAAGAIVSSTSGPISIESLLADRYGSDEVTGAFSGAQIYSAAGAGNTGPIITGTFALGAGTVAHPAHLNGRILTFTGAGRPQSSHRILRASGASPFSLTLSNPPGPYQFKAGNLPANGSPVVINGREFAGASGNEAWDGFDSQNEFLAHVTPDGVSKSNVEKPSFFTKSSWLTLKSDLSNPILADNDNDGVPDGVFLDFDLPAIPISSGTSVKLDASVLIVDLDSRFNVNAHGSLANMPLLNNARPTLYSPSDLWPTDFTDEPNRLAIAPLGSGVGPAEVNAFHLFSANALSAMNASVPRSAEEPGAGVLCGMVGGSQMGKRPVGSRFKDGENTPRIPSCEGRHGGHAVSQQAFWTSLIQPLRDPRIARASQASLRGVSDDDLQDPKKSTTNNGVPPMWWLSASGSSFDWGTTTNGRPLPRSVYNAPPDVHGRMKAMTRPVGQETTSDTDQDGRTTYGIVPRVSYAKPEWSTSSNLDAETSDNPYQTRLRSTGSRGGYVHAPTTNGSVDSPMPTNPFTLAELERLLRPYDNDTNQLPPRLIAMLGTIGEQMRMRLTSESWDTTAIVDGRITGAWGRIASALTTVSGSSKAFLYGSTPRDGMLGGEIAFGERFNLNRPLTGEKPSTYEATSPYYVQRQSYFKDLYTLLVLLDDAPTSLTNMEKAELAQWAANVVEFRDADSVMTPFEYDTDIFDGWDVDGDMTTTTDADRAVVFGAERPEAVLTHTLAWESDSGGELVLGIHRPWHAYAHATATTKIPAEPIDRLLDSAADPGPKNQLDLGRKSGGASYGDSAYPIWRLRIVSSGTAYVRFDDDTAGSGEFASDAVTNAVATPKLGTDSWLFIQPDSNSLYGGAAPWLTLPPETATKKRFTINQGGLFRAPGALAAAAPPTWPQPRPGKVYLERLADPTSTPTIATWTADPKTTTDLVRYVVVDQAPLQIVRRSPASGSSLADYAPTTVTQRRIPRLLMRRTEDETAFWKTDKVDDPNATTYDYLNPTAWSFGTRGEILTVPLLEESVADIDVAWMPWPNRPFFSAAELALVPKYSAIGMLENYRVSLGKKPAPSATPPVTLADGNAAETDLPRTVTSGTAWPILDAVSVPTLFAAIHDSWLDPNDHLASQTGIHRQTHPVNQLSAYREPGRVNLNTVTNEQVWNAAVSGPLAGGAVKTGSAAGFTSNPAKSMRDLLSLGAAAGSDPLRLDTNQTFTVGGTAALNVARNPMHRIYTAGRLANVATTRSNVFAIWITLRQQVPSDPDSVKYHRGFYIVDRSIPVGFQPGKDLNVRDAIVLRRIIE